MIHHIEYKKSHCVKGGIYLLVRTPKSKIHRNKYRATNETQYTTSQLCYDINVII